MPRGVGANQRTINRVPDEEATAFLAARRAATTYTSNHGGTVHSAAVERTVRWVHRESAPPAG
jgi:hypothetical protein